LASIRIADTTVLIDWLRGDPRARHLLRSVTEGGEIVLASVLSRMEILSGVRGEELPRVERLFDAIEWTPVTEEIADLAGEYSARYRRARSSIGPVDYLIGATARHVDAQLWTHNVRDFPMFPDLEPPY